MMPDCIKITYQPKTMTTPAPLSEDDLRQRWNQQADKHNQWESLDSAEQLAWAQAQAIKADRHAAALKAKPEEQRPTDEDLYDLAEQFHGDPVPAMRRALELWGNPLQGAPAPGENLAAVAREADMDHVEQLAAIIRRVDGNNSMGAPALAEAILGRYPCAFLVDPLDTPLAPVAEDSDRVAEIADAAIEAIRAIPALAPEPKRLFRIADELDQ